MNSYVLYYLGLGIGSLSGVIIGLFLAKYLGDSSRAKDSNALSGSGSKEQRP